ncbi:MAG TPA: isoaspartyl peptidase/L-asparaginase [Bdellovibrionales bacterium]|nr:isoaspartyl peptidase/L-asparaginase [Bdellovibrionales bacterium]
MSTRPILLIHGGAGSRPSSGKKWRILYESLEHILRDAYALLESGATAEAAVVRAVQLLEDDELYNAGRGSKIQSDGKIRMSASLMDGERQRFSGVVNVEGVKNPVLLAKRLATFESKVLSGAGAKKFARENGFEFASPYTEKAWAAFNKKKRGKSGTVGAVALDKKGRLAAATSTGGRGYEYPFRVSDSPTVAGNYSNRVCAVSATGTGEHIVDFAAAARICTLVEAGHNFDKVTRKLVADAKRANAEFGFIALDRKGHWTGLTSTAHLVWAAAGPDGFKIHP